MKLVARVTGAVEGRMCILLAVSYYIIQLPSPIGSEDAP